MLLSEFITQAQKLLIENGDKEILITSIDPQTHGTMFDHPEIHVTRDIKTGEVIRYTL